MINEFERRPHIELCPRCFKAKPCELHPDPPGCRIVPTLIIPGMDPVTIEGPIKP